VPPAGQASPAAADSKSIPRPDIPGQWPQPAGTIPIINAIGAIVAWAAGPTGPPSGVSLRDPTAFAARPIYNHRGQIILWFDGNASTPNAPHRYPATHDHFIPVVDQQGMVIDWREWDQDADNCSLAALPSDAPGPRPILTHVRYGQTIAWLIPDS
jgi:hypothetical protein